MEQQQLQMLLQQQPMQLLPGLEAALPLLLPLPQPMLQLLGQLQPLLEASILLLLVPLPT